MSERSGEMAGRRREILREKERESPLKLAEMNAKDRMRIYRQKLIARGARQEERRNTEDENGRFRGHRSPPPLLMVLVVSERVTHIFFAHRSHVAHVFNFLLTAAAALVGSSFLKRHELNFAGAILR